MPIVQKPQFSAKSGDLLVFAPIFAASAIDSMGGYQYCPPPMDSSSDGFGAAALN